MAWRKETSLDNFVSTSFVVVLRIKTDVSYDVCGKDLTVSVKNRNKNDNKSTPYIALDNYWLKSLRNLPLAFVQPNLWSHSL